MNRCLLYELYIVDYLQYQSYVLANGMEHSQNRIGLFAALSFSGNLYKAASLAEVEGKPDDLMLFTSANPRKPCVYS